MKTDYSCKIYSATKDLPQNWDEIAQSNLFLTQKYLRVLESSAPINMKCFFIGVFKQDTLICCALSQFLDAESLTSFGDRDRCMRTTLRNVAFKNFASHVLILGNNMLTGQNAFVIHPNEDKSHAILQLQKSLTIIQKKLKSEGKKVHIISIKDFNSDEIDYIKPLIPKNYVFSTQPNMVFKIRKEWESENNYIDALQKKYRNQYKRARKKASAITKRKLSLSEIIELEDEIYSLYFHVAKNAPFNTFFLAKNHFRVLKENLEDSFFFYGYFLEDKLIGFNTLIKHGKIMETYFLGYDEIHQRDKLLYLNMLYDMIAYSIKKKFKKIIFARTALEIKSSVGAVPIEMYGIIQHSNALIQSQMPKLFSYFEPESNWIQRNPFK